MIKRIAISLKKEYWHQIIDGQKPVEFRKYAPTENPEEPFLAIVHESGTYAWQGVILFYGAEKDQETGGYCWIIRQVFTFPEGRRPMAYYKKKNGQPITGWPQTFIELSR